MYKLYLDDSGSHAQSSTFVLAGCVATADNWIAFIEEWNALLKAFSLAWLHMSDAEAGKEDFKGWDPPSRYEAIEAFSALVQRHIAYGFCASFDHKKWRERIKPLYEKQEKSANKERLLPTYLGGPYSLAYGLGIDLAAKMCRSLGVSPRELEIVLARQGREEWGSGYYWYWQQKRLGFSAPRFEEPRHVPPLQAADMYAWRQSRSFERPEERVPRRHRRLLDGVMHVRGHMDTDLIEAMAQQQERSYDAVARALQEGRDPIEAVDEIAPDDPNWPRGPLEFPRT